MLRWLTLIVVLIGIIVFYFRGGSFDTKKAITHIESTLQSIPSLKSATEPSSSASEAYTSQESVSSTTTQDSTDSIGNTTSIEQPSKGYTLSNSVSTQPSSVESTGNLETVINQQAITPLDSDDNAPKIQVSEEAKIYLEALVASPKTAIDALTAKNFVTAEQLIKLPTLSIQPQVELIVDNPTTIAADTPSSSNIDNQITEVIVDSAAQIYAVNPVTFKPAQITEPPQIESSNDQLAVRNKTMPVQIGQTIQLKELLDPIDTIGKRIFYIHAVSPEDEQGIWGIMQNSLTETFAQGLTLSEQSTLLTVTIPREADEVLTNRHSSFLGKLLNDKVKTTYIYNYEQGLVGQNPNLIKPGQQLIIITFTEDELLSIYQQFKDEL